jgi:Lecithin:cholesterol acyltransferase
MDDLVVVVPGIMGSALVDADGKAVWSLRWGGIIRALRTFGQSITALTLPPDLGDAPAPDGVEATEIMGGFHVIPGVWSPIVGYEPLLGFLKRPRFGLVADDPDDADAPPGNLILFPYDWRLSNRFNAGVLKERVETALERWQNSAPERSDAKVVFICHSMGGLLVRWYLHALRGADITRALVTLGTPYRGVLNALDQLVNGVRKGIGPLERDLSSFARSLPSVYQLLPEYACVKPEHGDLRKTTEVRLPSLEESYVADAMRFHNDLDRATAKRNLPYELVPVVGIDQPTWTTAEIVGDRVVPKRTIQEEDLGGDGTVPRLAARPKNLGERDASIRGFVEGHGALTANQGILDGLNFILTAQPIILRLETYYQPNQMAVSPRDREPASDEERQIGMSVEELHALGEPVVATISCPVSRTLEVALFDEQGYQLTVEPAQFGGGRDEGGRLRATASFGALSPGGYVLEVRAPDDPEFASVRTTTLVWEDKA